MLPQDLLSSHEIKTCVEELETLNKSYKSVRAHQLAKAGFFFDVNNKETICPICSFTKPVSYWIKGRNPKDTHKRESPRCEFVLKCEGRWHFLARNQRQAVAHGNRTVARPGETSQAGTQQYNTRSQPLQSYSRPVSILSHTDNPGSAPANGKGNRRLKISVSLNQVKVNKHFSFNLCFLFISRSQ